MTDLLTRLLALAELAVSEALEFDYGDPEDRYIWRELQELKPLVAAAMTQPEPPVEPSTMTRSEQWAVVSWVEDHIDTNKALRSWRDPTRGGLLMAEVHTVQPGARARAAMTQPEAESSITFNESRDSEVMRVDQRGFHYRGELIEDAGLAHRLMVTYLQRNTSMHPEVVEREDAQPEPEELTDEQLLELIPQQTCDDLAAASRALAKQAGTAAGIFRNTLNRGVIDYARIVLNHKSQRH
jgi:hypothetical protein